MRKDAPQVSDEIFRLGVPVLGICYGLYLVVNAYKGEECRSKFQRVRPRFYYD